MPHIQGATATVLDQIEACLNSRPLTPLPEAKDGCEALTPGHFLIERPLEALPDPSSTGQAASLLSCWQLCQLSATFLAEIVKRVLDPASEVHKVVRSIA